MDALADLLRKVLEYLNGCGFECVGVCCIDTQRATNPAHDRKWNEHAGANAALLQMLEPGCIGS
jgi:hypothetical protein